jgi:hypothetical protein
VVPAWVVLVAVELAVASAAEVSDWQQEPSFHREEFRRYSAKDWRSCSLANWQMSALGLQSEIGTVSAVALEGVADLPARRPEKVLVGLGNLVAFLLTVVAAQVASAAEQVLRQSVAPVHSLAACR